MASHLSIKFLVVGDENVGKTTITNYFALVPVKAVSTVGIDFQTRMVALSSDSHQRGHQKEYNKKINDGYSAGESESLLLSTMKVGIVRPNDYDYVKCCFWDTSGSQNYQCLAQTYYTGIAAVVVVFDLSSQSSYNNINSYIARVIQKNTCNHSHPILVLGNKLDKRAIRFTKKQVFEALCFDFPHENIRYEEVSCIDKMNSLDYGCAGCANSSDIHVVFNSFIQSLYDSVVKPHYYNPQAIAAIDCRGITGTSRFFKERPDKERPDKERPDKERPDKERLEKERLEKDVSKNGWNWRGNYSDYIHGTDSKKNGSNDYIQMNNLKSPRECCSEHELKRVSSCTSGCSIM
jgi:small GTP-binding protein